MSASYRERRIRHNEDEDAWLSNIPSRPSRTRTRVVRQKLTSALKSDRNVPMKFTEKKAKYLQYANEASEVIQFGMVAWGYVKMAKQWHDKRHTWIVTVSPEDDPRLFESVIRWLPGQIPATERRPLQAVVTYKDDDTRAIVTAIDPSDPITVLIDGHKVVISFGSQRRNGSSEGDADGRYFNTPLLNFRARTREGRDAVLKHLDTLIHKVERPKLFLRDGSSYRGWGMRDLPERGLSTVILAEGIVENVFNDLKFFRGAEAEYARLGQPYHRGYVFYGPPGTGKSSFIQALANELNMNVYYLTINGLTSSRDLENLISAIQPNSILLIEDVDTISVTKTREDGEDSDNALSLLTLSDILNVLDGVLTPHGLVTMLTTNHLDRIDPALLRPGRADKKIKIDNLTTEQANRIIQTMYPQAKESSWFPFAGGIKEGVSGADITAVIKDNMHGDVASLPEALAAFFESSTLEE